MPLRGAANAFSRGPLDVMELIMKALISATAIAMASVVGLSGSATAQDASKIVTPQEIEWGNAPASLPPGAQGALFHGDPAKDGPFALRLKLPKGYTIPPHGHGKPEIVTVISGTLRLGMGETVDPVRARALPAGGFFAMTPGMVHFAVADEDTVIQLNSVGPWSITYVNSKDDPRQASK